MFTKLFQKVTQPPQHDVPQGSVTVTDLDPRVAVHYGIPSTASILAFDPIQRLLAIGTLDGRIKVIGGDNIEVLLISPRPLPFKNLEFLQNQGFLASVSNENEVQIWDLEQRRIASNLQWESNITAFSIICGTHYMYIGDEYGFLSVLKYDAEEGKILHLPYHIPANLIAEAAGISLPNHPSIVGVLSQPCSFGNRVLIAFENGLIILWDVTEDRPVVVRGYKDLQLKDETVIESSKELVHEHSTDASDHEQAEKDISSLCWVSSDGSILAVGYVDGDILLWNLSTAAYTKDQQAQKSSNNVVKLQLSSGSRRLPVIVLHWSANRAHNDRGGQLFVYGGDDIGSEEVLTILNLEWSSGIETLKCIGRVDLTLNGSFADMILVPNAGATESSDTTSLFVLNNPGQLHFYDDACLSTLMSRPEKKNSVHAVQYHAVVPTAEPYMTVAKLNLLQTEGSFSRALLEAVSAAKLQVAHTTTKESTKWPLTGGVPSQLSFSENNGIEKVYIAGYQDGSVRIWDATFPVLSLIFVLGSEVDDIGVAGASASVSALDFCSSTLCLAVGNEYGLVRLYRLIGNSDETSLHFVTETKHEVHNMHYENGAQCTAVFSLLNSPVCTLQYVNSGVRLAVGFECGRVVMLDISSVSVLFLTDCVTSSSSPAISLAVKTFPDPHNNSLDHSENRTSNASARESVFILTRDAHIVIMDSATGNMISSWSMHPNKESTAISIYILEGNISVSEESSEKHSLVSSQDCGAKNEPAQTNAHHESDSLETEFVTSTPASYLGQRFTDSLVLLCSEDALCLYSSKSLIQGNNNSIHRVNLAKPCCWTTIFKKDEKACGLIVVYQTGLIEIRSLPDLELVGESSLMSILRWNFRINMNKTMSSSDTGQITLVNGCEFAFISLLAFENDFRIPEALPCLHDKVLEAAANAAVSFSQNQKKKQVAGTAPGILGGIIKGFKGGKADDSGDFSEDHQTVIAHLEGIFSRFPFSDPSTSIADDQEIVEFNIDDIEIDNPAPVSSSSHKSKNDRRDEETEREKLFDGGATDTKPRLRTPEEIMAKYRKAGDASAAAAHARDRLLERQEKLEKLSKRTEELQSGAENFASMANELAKTMENRKWWNI
uniref:V-SNARE coiled-coil homology domain-containing protein n=1 Tax=Davidia involucrata TaxID=16924 RepID=A0A5B7BCF9_DAVIN